MTAAVLAAVVCGCATVRNENSITFADPVTHGLGPICNVMSAPLAGDFKKCIDCKDLKKGTSSEVIYFQFYEPLVSGGSEAIKSAMVKGGITDLYYADYSVRFFFILGWYTVTAYGK